MSRWIPSSLRWRELGPLYLIVAVAAGSMLAAGAGGMVPFQAALTPEAHGASMTSAAVFIPGAAHVTGAADTNWRTDLEIYNPDPTAPAQYEISLLERDVANGSPVTVPFQLMAGRSVRYQDVLFSLFSFTGSAALRVTATTGQIVVSSRTYNLTTAGTYGQYIGAALEERAIHHGEEARIIQLAQSVANDDGYRTNLGFVNATASTTVIQVDLFGWDGALLGNKTYNLDPFTFTQKDRIFRTVTQAEVSDGYAVVRVATPGGAVFAYASVVDNRTGDPIFIPAVVVDDASAPTPTPTQPPSTPTGPPPTQTPTRTPTPTSTQPASQPNLLPYQPQGWDGPIVVSGVPGTSTSGGLVGGQTTYLDVAFTNDGQADAVFDDGVPAVEILIDDQSLGYLSFSGTVTLEPGDMGSAVDVEVTGIPAGEHTVMMIVDPLDGVVESNESDNSASFTGTWSGLMGEGASGSAGRRLDARLLRRAPIPDLVGVGREHRSAAERRAKARWAAARASSSSAVPAFLKATGEPLYIPATAHVAGAAGTNWRTDLELHNPGATQGQYEVALLLRNQANPAPMTVTYSVAPGRCLRLNDVLYSLFGFEGGASLRITPLAGSLVATSRTYNLTDEGTYGQFIGGAPVSEAIGDGEAGAFIQLTHHRGSGVGFRTNIGFVNCGDIGITVRADLYRWDGSLLGTRTWGLDPFMHRQVDRVFEAVSQQEIEDGYIVVSTSTPGGRFHAYASVVDNATGDPVYIPATKVGPPGPPQTPTPGLTPTPTPTMTPTVVPGVPMDPRTTADWIFDLLGTIEPGSNFDLENQVALFQQLGLDGALNLVVTQYPEFASRIPNGVALDFGSGYSFDDGTLVSGQLRMTFEILVSSPARIEADARMTQTNLQINGTYPLIDTLDGSARVDIDVDGHVAGTYSFLGTGSSPMKRITETVTGNVDVDTAVCPNYPIGGSVTVVRGDDEHVFTFTDACDGSYGYLGPGSTGDVAFRLRWDGPEDLDIYVIEPSGEMIWFANPTSATGGQLDVDSNVACTVHDPQPTENVFWPVGQAPHGSYEFWAQLWSDCGGSQTPAITFYVFEGTDVVREIPGVIADGTSPHYTHVY